MRLSRFEALAAAFAGAVVCGAVWIGLRGSEVADTAALHPPDRGQAQARLRVRVKACEDRLSAIEAAVEVRGTALTQLEARLAALDDG